MPVDGRAHPAMSEGNLHQPGRDPLVLFEAGPRAGEQPRRHRVSVHPLRRIPHAALIAERKEALAREMTREMGKVLNEARGDVQEAIDMAYYMAGEGRRQ